MKQLITALVMLIAVVAALVYVYTMENKTAVNLYTTPLIFPQEQ